MLRTVLRCHGQLQQQLTLGAARLANVSAPTKFHTLKSTRENQNYELNGSSPVLYSLSASYSLLRSVNTTQSCEWSDTESVTVNAPFALPHASTQQKTNPLKQLEPSRLIAGQRDGSSSGGDRAMSMVFDRCGEW